MIAERVKCLKCLTLTLSASQRGLEKNVAPVARGYRSRFRCQTVISLEGPNLLFERHSGVKLKYNFEFSSIIADFDTFKFK